MYSKGFFLQSEEGICTKAAWQEPEKGSQQCDRRVGWELRLVRSLPQIHGIGVDEQPNGSRDMCKTGEGEAGQVRGVPLKMKVLLLL
ncbi:hypothetical protein TSUD_383810 [Trifolium subterraneum]|uniref:Uncharacterized protein n=1 Tax=Trifolium subterraneum TaxID=3900 RepID=A0A2Z6NWF8_TRISU|nr:hypothetical protein TSUD_383810 [Trifolium subterraneum]